MQFSSIVIMADPLATPPAGTHSLVFRKSDLERYQNTNLGEIIELNTPAFVKNYGPGALATPSLRGTGAGHTQVYWNRIPLNSGLVGLSDLSLLPGILADNVELRYGTGSLNWGTGGLGGGINLANSPPQLYSDRQIRGTFQSEMGSFGTWTGSGNLEYQTKKLKMRSKAVYMTAENNYPYVNIGRVGFPEETLDRADFQQLGFMQEVYYNSGFLGNFSGLFWGHLSDRNLPPTMLTADQGESQKDQNFRGMLNWNRNFGSHKATIRTAHFWEDQQYTNDLVGINSEYRLNTTHVQGDFVYRDRRLEWLESVVAGFSGFYARAQSAGFDQPRDQWMGGAYLQANGQLRFLSGLNYHAVVRQEVIKGKAQALAPNLGLKLFLFDNHNAQTRLSVRSSGGRNYRFPSLNELYWTPGGNPDLEPEIAWTGDAGLTLEKGYTNHTRSVIRLDAGIFATRASNWIQWVPGSGAVWEPQNVKTVYARGGEGEVSINGSVKSLFFLWKGSYAFTRSTNRETQDPQDPALGKQLIYVPVHTGNTSLLLTWRNWNLGYQHLFNGKRYTTADHAESLPAYQLGNAWLSHNFYLGKTKLTLKGEVRNLWDEQYQAIQWRPMPGRMYLGSLTFHFTPISQNNE